MKRIEINSISDLMTVAGIIIEMSAKSADAEVWHPSLVWSAPRFTDSEWDEVASHAPTTVPIRITTPYRVVIIRDFWRSPEFLDTPAVDGGTLEAYDIRLNLLVARAIKRLMGGHFTPAIIDINVDWGTAVPVIVSTDKVPRRRRRPRR